MSFNKDEYAEIIERSKLLLLKPEEREGIRQTKIALELVALIELCTEYNIDINKYGTLSFTLLAIELAKKYEPLFKVSKKRGAKNKWDECLGGILAAQIDGLVKSNDDSGKGFTWAIAQLVKKEPWKSITKDKNDPKELLRKQYYNYRDSPVKNLISTEINSSELDTELCSFVKKIYCK